MVKILAALSILNSSGASPNATEKVTALVARATCSGASHSYADNTRSYIHTNGYEISAGLRESVN